MEQSSEQTASQLQAAIRALEDETARYEAQSETLDRAKPLLISRTANILGERVPQDQSLGSEFDRLHTAVRTLVAEIQHESNRARDEQEAKAAWLMAATSKALGIHDKTYIALNNDRSDQASEFPEIDCAKSLALLQALQHTVTQAVQYKLNNEYLNELSAGVRDVDTKFQPSNDIDGLQADEISALRVELTSLSAEIPVVTEMLVKHDYGQALQALYQTLHILQTKLQIDDETFVLRQLGGMQDELEDLTRQVEFLRSSRVLTEHFESLIDEIRSDRRSVVPAQVQSSHDTDLSLKSRRRRSGVDQRRESKPPFEQYMRAVDQVMTDLSLRLEQFGSEKHSVSTTKIQNDLDMLQTAIVDINERTV